MKPACRNVAPMLLLASLLAVSPCAAGNSGSVVSISPNGLAVPLLTVAQPDSGALVILVRIDDGRYDMYSQRLDRHGHAMLGELGQYLMPYDTQNYSLNYLDDGAGGAVLVQSVAKGATGYDIVVWRVASDGSLSYGANGIVVCNATRDQTQPFLVQGPAGFFYVAWKDDRANLGGKFDIYAQKVSLAGVPQWTANGVLVNTATYRPWSYGIDSAVSDRQGGLLLTWTYNSYGGVTRAQRVSSTGALQWTANGVDFGDPSYGVRGLAADGLGGAWGTMGLWNGTNTHFYAYHMGATGTPAFVGGVEYLPAAYNGQSTLIRNASGGCFIHASIYNSSSQTTPSLYRQELSSTGTLLRGASGEYLGSSAAPVVQDVGSAYLLSSYSALLDPVRRTMRVQKYGLDGVAQFPGTGVTLGRSEGYWYDVGTVPSLAMSSTGVIMASWTDTRYVSPSSMLAIHAFGQALTATGAPLWDDSELPGLLTARDAAGDQGGYLRATWAPSIADHPGARAATGYRVWRALPSSANAQLSSARPAADGMFRSGERTLLALTGTYWELAGEQPAATLPGYARTVPTGMDSTAGNPADQSFMVEAYDDSSHHWFSNTLTGHSVDNLAPAMVSPVAGHYANGSTALYWGGVPDTDLSAYEVFRGSSPSFVPSPANRIATTTGLSWNDPAGAPALYRIAARDIHGNLGPSALVVPDGTVDVASSGPKAWRLNAGWRSGALQLALDVPRADDGRVEVLDVSGRRIWETTFQTDGARALEFHVSPSAKRGGILYVRATSSGGAAMTRKVVVLP